MTMKLCVGSLVMALLLNASTLYAQAERDSGHLRNYCRLAKQVLETGHPAPHAGWALRQIGACGPATQGGAVATAVRRLRAESDTAVLRQYWRASRYLLDGELFRASYEIAGDAAASTEARVFALLSLLHTVRFGRSAEYQHLIGGFSYDSGLRSVRGGCARIVVNDDVRLEGTPLPDDYVGMVRLLAARLSADMTAPLDVQTAAACL